MTRESIGHLSACLMAHAYLVSSAHGQEAMLAESATQPSPGHYILKEQLHYFRLDDDSSGRDRSIEDWELLSILNVGLTSDLSLSLRLPAKLRREHDALTGDTDQVEGIGDATILAKWRFYQNDSGPIDTQRLSAIVGMDIRTGDQPFTNDAYTPIVGLAYTQIAGRHGMSADVLWQITTAGNRSPVYAGESTADLFRYDFAYLYRIHPESYSLESTWGLYAVCEWNGYYETNGDNEILFSPGLMIEATTWALEFSVPFPVWQDIDHRAELQYSIMAGLRFSF